MSTGVPTLSPTGVAVLSPTGIPTLGISRPMLPDATHRILIPINDCKGTYYGSTPQDPAPRAVERYMEDVDAATAAGFAAIERGAASWSILVQQVITGIVDPDFILDPSLLWPSWSALPGEYHTWWRAIGTDVREHSRFPYDQHVMSDLSDADWVALMDRLFPPGIYGPRPPGSGPTPPTQIWIDASPDLTIDRMPGLNLLLHGTAPPWDDATWENFYPGHPRPEEHHRADRRWPRWMANVLNALPVP